jgi:hypothetical protein
MSNVDLVKYYEADPIAKNILKDVIESFKSIFEGLEMARKQGVYSFSDARILCNCIEVMDKYLDAQKKASETATIVEKAVITELLDEKGSDSTDKVE